MLASAMPSMINPQGLTTRDWASAGPQDLHQGRIYIDWLASPKKKQAVKLRFGFKF
jgi:hypothetical protein